MICLSRIDQAKRCASFAWAGSINPAPAKQAPLPSLINPAQANQAFKETNGICEKYKPAWGVSRGRGWGSVCLLLWHWTGNMWQSKIACDMGTLPCVIWHLCILVHEKCAWQIVFVSVFVPLQNNCNAPILKHILNCLNFSCLISIHID